MTAWQQIDCEVTFTRERPPGFQLSWPKNLNGRFYRPLFRVGDAFFGVLVDSGPKDPALETPMTVTVTLMVPDVSYDVLAPGIRFAICEGPIEVGFGTVLSRHEPKDWPA